MSREKALRFKPTHYPLIALLGIAALAVIVWSFREQMAVIGPVVAGVALFVIVSYVTNPRSSN
jgi:hypothetical protein